MAIADVIGKVYSSQVLTGVTQNTSLVSLSKDRSNEIRGGGDGVIFANASGLVAVGDYPTNGNITYTGLSPTGVTIALDKKKYVACQLEDIDNVQLQFDLLAEAAREGGKDLGKQMTADFRTAIAGETIPSGQKNSLEKAKPAATAEERLQIHLLVLTMATQFKTLGYENPYLICHPALWFELIRYTVEDASAGIVAQREQAFRDATLSNLYGIDIIPDWGAGAITAAAHKSYGGVRNRTLAHAIQLRKTESIRHQGRFLTRWRQLVMYGMVVGELDSLHSIEITSAS